MSLAGLKALAKPRVVSHEVEGENFHFKVFSLGQAESFESKLKEMPHIQASLETLRAVLCNESGELILVSDEDIEAVKALPLPAFEALLKAALSSAGYGAKAVEEAKKN